jgi:hypothetical protein
VAGWNGIRLEDHEVVTHNLMLSCQANLRRPVAKNLIFETFAPRPPSVP